MDDSTKVLLLYLFFDLIFLIFAIMWNKFDKTDYIASKMPSAPTIMLAVLVANTLNFIADNYII